ncbi:MAG: hypothetical protein JW882_18715 [Deltaproteobacteria bacterium]|nr:hypothetical protein [Deltaproteobacteria bacterium]
MNTGTVRLNITLHKDLVTELDELTGPRKRSQFIAKAVEMSIQKAKRDRIEKLLEEGYQSTRQEGLDLTKEFEEIDLEGWYEY